MRVIIISRIKGNTYTSKDGVSQVSTSSGTCFFVDTEDEVFLRHYTWCLSGNGYIMSRSTGACTILHRLLCGAQPGDFVDHINGDPLDNRKKNLRVCRKQQNEFNTKVRRDNTVGFRGVCPARRGKYRAYIVLNGKQHSLGQFDNPNDAARAYNKAALIYFGEFARLNIVKD